MKLLDLITAVKEQKLSKEDLENYRDQLSYLYADLQLELAELEKARAIKMEELRAAYPEASEVKLKGNWQGRPEGQREIVLKRYCLATKEMLNSLKSRLYSVY